LTEVIQKIALGIIRHDDHVLMVERRKKELGGDNELLNWAFPGGKIEPGETPFNTAEREVYEETGRYVHALSTLDETQHSSFPAYIYYIACSLSERSAEKVTDKAIIQAKWVPIAKLGMFITSSLNEKVQQYLDS
jgi:8-oxo-dGTP diphosphatase